MEACCLGVWMTFGDRVSPSIAPGVFVTSVCIFFLFISQSCLTLKLYGLQTPDLHYLPAFAQTHVQCVGEASQPSHPLLLSKHRSGNTNRLCFSRNIFVYSILPLGSEFSEQYRSRKLIITPFGFRKAHPGILDNMMIRRLLYLLCAREHQSLK